MKEKHLALRYSIRISGSVTSISLRRNLVSLWLCLNIDSVVEIDRGKLQGKVQNFIYSCIDEWKKDNAKGLSDFVSDKMIEDIIDEKDFRNYALIFDTI